MTVQPSCAMSGGPANVTLLLVLGAGAEAGETVALSVTDLDRRLANHHRSSCELSAGPDHYSIRLLGADSPA